MTAEQKKQFEEFIAENLPRPEKLISYSDVEWDGVMGHFHERVGLAFSAFMAGIEFAKSNPTELEKLIISVIEARKEHSMVSSNFLSSWNKLQEYMAKREKVNELIPSKLKRT